MLWILQAGADETCDIYIEGGLIAAVDKAISVSGAEVIEAGGLYAAPGLVDMHVHLRDPRSDG